MRDSTSDAQATNENEKYCADVMHNFAERCVGGRK
jgi:hypothetical protein